MTDELSKAVKVSVIIPTYNRANVLQRAVESVLEQSLQDFEVLICDDASTDATVDIANNYQERDARFRVFSLPVNQGPAAARNLGIFEATGEYIAFLDSDDEWLPNKLELQIQRLQQPHSNVKICIAGEYRIINGNIGHPIKRVLPKDHETDSLRKLLTGKIQYSTSSLMIRRDCLLDIGGFNPQMRVHEDQELMVRLFLEYQLGVVPGPLLKTHYLVSNVRKLLNHLEVALPYELKNLPRIDRKLDSWHADFFKANLYSIILYSAIRERKIKKILHYLRLRQYQKLSWQSREIVNVFKSMLVAIFGDQLQKIVTSINNFRRHH